QRFATLISLPLVNNYSAVNGVIRNDVYGMGDPLIIGRYLVANTKCKSTDLRTVHRVMLGAGGKIPLARHNVTYNNTEVDMDQQPGTGTWDALASAEYMVRRGRNGASVSAIGRRNSSNAEDHRMGHGISTTVEFFRRWDLNERLKLMPSLGVYHELYGKDAMNGEAVQGTGSSTLFAHAGSRVWWRSWAFSATFQLAVARSLGEQMIPNRERVVVGLTYNLIRS
ncbi:MAG TPA: hypothetical protein PK760_15710, partial [Flavobacteriales bacterium]|nr:hypothetical protein [Flavobacteriales bacterium]